MIVNKSQIKNCVSLKKCSQCVAMIIIVIIREAVTDKRLGKRLIEMTHPILIV